MNIGIIIGRFPPDRIGGAELQTEQLAKELARRGHLVTVFTRRYNRRPYQQWQDGYLIRRRNELPISGLRMVWDNFPALWNVGRHQPRPEILLCYQTLNSGLIGVMAQFLFGIPAAISIRGNNEYRIQSSIINRFLVPSIYSRAKHLIVQSPRILDDLHTQLKSAGQATLSNQLQSKITVLPNGVQMVSPSARSDRKKIIYVGRLIRNKGVADLLLAVKHLPHAEVVIVGDGPDRKRLETLADGMAVTFVGEVKPSAVLNYLRKARMLILPSYRGDGFPNVILEAMSCGVPVIATRTAGIPDLVQHKETGFLFKPGDIQQMVSYTGRLLEDDELWYKLHRQSLANVQSYSWDAIVPRIENLLASVLR